MPETGGSPRSAQTREMQGAADLKAFLFPIRVRASRAASAGPTSVNMDWRPATGAFASMKRYHAYALAMESSGSVSCTPSERI